MILGNVLNVRAYCKDITNFLRHTQCVGIGAVYIKKKVFTVLNKMTGEEMIPDENMEPVEDEAVRNIMIEKLKQAIVELHPAEREILDLIYFQGFSERQAGALLKIEQSVVNKKKMRALKKCGFSWNIITK